jgi:RimJ/RimL family protein N-acetyltransferase
MIYELETDRLKLRQWRSDDAPLLAAMNADSRVMEYFPKLMTKDESDVLATQLETLIIG